MGNEVKWTKEQEQAIYEKGNNILVAAAAGSGKTAVLVERIINKIINEKVDIDKLLVVTFTNAAAQEMRERILNAIYKKIDDNPEDERLQKQVTLLNKASICTIDSFCLDVVRNNFFEIFISPNFRIGDTTEIEILKQDVIEDIFEEKYENEDKDFQKLINTYTSYQDDTPLKELVLKIYTYIQSNPFPEKWLHEKVEMFNLQDKIKQDFSQTIWGKILLKQAEEILEDAIIKLTKERDNLLKYPELIDYVQIINDDIDQIETMKANTNSWDMMYTLATNFKLKNWKVNKKITLEAKEMAKQTRDKVKKTINGLTDKILIFDSEEANTDINDMYQILLKLKDLIIEFGQKFTKRKKDKNIVDFSDIEHYALKILLKEENGQYIQTEIAKKYQQKFEEIAIDEYQDSNLVQEQILTSISRGNNIFMVGDVKQSIYKFRQARPDLFLEKYKTYQLKENKKEEQDLKIQLFKNFRSRKQVLDFTNIIFENIMGEELGELNYTQEEYLNLGANYEETKEDLRTEIDILNIAENIEENDIEQIETNEEEENEETERVEDIELEAKFVANRIKQLKENKFEVYDVKKQEKREIKYKDIVVLLRSTKESAPIFEKEIIKLGMPVFSDSSSEYLESIEIQTIMNLLKIIDNPLQEIPLVAVMRSVIGGFTDNELVQIRLNDRYDNFYNTILKAKPNVDEKLKNKINMFLNNLEMWRKEQEYLALDELIWKIYNDTGYFNYVGLMANGELRQANLKMLFERAKQCESISFKGLYNFINYIEKIKTSSKDMDSAKIIGENDDVIRIMSIHKSKGLEFPVVFLSGTGKQFNMQDLNNKILLHPDIGIGVKCIDYERQIEYDTLSKKAIREKILQETLAEEMRVLYVALTRAKEKLIITGYSKNDEEKLEKMTEFVSKYEKEDKINPIVLKKYKTFIDWIRIVYLYNQKQMKELAIINVYKKEDILKKDKTEENENKKIKEIVDKLNSIEIDENKQKEIVKIIEYEYPYKKSTVIPTKSSVTQLKQLALGETEIKKVEIAKPQFLEQDTEIKITNAEKGTLVHLCMQKLNLKKEIYSLEDVKSLVKELELKQIITQKQAEAINVYKVYKFTQSNIWKEIVKAKKVEREKPFYINIPAKEIYNENVEENVLVQGIIDLYYINQNDELVLLDYKTDFVENQDEKVLIEKYKTQLDLYKKALENSLNRKVDKIYIYSTYLDKEIQITA